ncbi:hypothetical protein ASPCAL07953 [Aspergillus calidoustus]|uniref:CFEM domain-containing protein n=1 Tax=Aspergillus calidoustus TaxID=454130 RepID=A0A0U5CPU1_ASPCI|nr:hypothetical protein ASPCAL07953 [Aspergillus calidoustus]
MHSILTRTLSFPLLLLPATVLAQTSVEDLIRDLLPGCVHSCALDTMESLYSCSLDDAACFCEGDVTTLTVLEEWLQCPNSNCDEEDIRAMMLGPEDINNQFRGVCDRVDTGSGGGSDTANESDSGDETSSDSDSGSGDSEEETNEEVSEDGASTLSSANILLAAGAIILAAFL